MESIAEKEQGRSRLGGLLVFVAFLIFIKSNYILVDIYLRNDFNIESH